MPYRRHRRPFARRMRWPRSASSASRARRWVSYQSSKDRGGEVLVGLWPSSFLTWRPSGSASPTRWPSRGFGDRRPEGTPTTPCSCRLLRSGVVPGPCPTLRVARHIARALPLANREAARPQHRGLRHLLQLRGDDPRCAFVSRRFFYFLRAARCLEEVEAHLAQLRLCFTPTRLRRFCGRPVHGKRSDHNRPRWVSVLIGMSGSGRRRFPPAHCLYYFGRCT